MAEVPGPPVGWPTRKRRCVNRGAESLRRRARSASKVSYFNGRFAENTEIEKNGNVPTAYNCLHDQLKNTPDETFIYRLLAYFSPSQG